jgi:hypothetical protein
MTLTQSPALTRIRDSWHRVAEHVLAAGQFAASGTIRLRQTAGGYATTAGVDGRQLAVVGLTLVMSDGDARRTAPLTTIGALAAFAGVRPGLSGSYSPTTAPDLEALLTGEEQAAETLAAWFSLGTTSLRRFADEAGHPQEPVLWPEHFDLGVTVSEVNYGFSPGDEQISEPYVYVMPHAGPPSSHPFWNAPFGAALTADRIRTTDDAVAFSTEGRALTERSRT